jgi:hypothetical protein
VVVLMTKELISVSDFFKGKNPLDWNLGHWSYLFNTSMTIGVPQIQTTKHGTYDSALTDSAIF